MTMLNIVDENDNVIGQASRSEIHKNGLRHREVHVFFVTPQRQIVFQKRADNKDSFPGWLDATAGGHVELGQDYHAAALAEVAEETGVSLPPQELVFIKKYSGSAADPKTDTRNCVFRAIYGYVFKGAISDLVIEADNGAGFEVIDIDSLLQAGAGTANVLRTLLGPEYQDVYKTLDALVSERV